MTAFGQAAILKWLTNNPLQVQLLISTQCYKWTLSHTPTQHTDSRSPF